MVPLLLLLLPSIGDGQRWDYSSVLAQPLTGKVESLDRLQIERIGGLAGFGGPHLKSRGELALSALSSADRQAVEDLFSHPEKAVQPPVGAAGFFSYTITRQTPAGTQTITVPETAVPAALKNIVRDVIE
jgi:hypothetical protein